MKKIIVSTAILLVLSSMAYSKGGFWKKLGRITQSVVSSVGGAILDEQLQREGYSKDESRQMINDFHSALGIDSRDATRGIEFMDANKKEQINMVADLVIDATGELTERSDITNQIKKGVDGGFAVSNTDNKYEQANIVTTIALDVVGDFTGGHEVTDRISSFVDNTLTYRSDISKAKTLEELQQAIDKKDKADKELFYDIGMALYDHMERKNNSPKSNSTPNIEQSSDNSTYKETPFIPQENTLDLPRSVVSETQNIAEPSDYTDILDTTVYNRQENMPIERKEKVDVLSDIPQEDTLSSIVTTLGSKQPIEHLFPEQSIPQSCISDENDMFCNNFEQNKRLSTESLEVSHKERIDDTQSFHKEETEPLAILLAEDLSEQLNHWEVATDEEKAKVRLENIRISSTVVNAIGLSAEKTQQLDEIAANLKQYPELRITLIFYSGTNENEKNKGFKQAMKVREYLLIKKGIESERIFITNKEITNRYIELSVFKRGDP